MAEKEPSRFRYQWVSPDGTAMEKITPNWIHHTLAVMGYMRLKKQLPKINPKDDKEEPRYDRFQQWILIGTSENMEKAERLAAIQGYKESTDEVRFIPLSVSPYNPPPKKGAADESDPPEAEE